MKGGGGGGGGGGIVSHLETIIAGVAELLLLLISPSQSTGVAVITNHQ